MKQNIELTKEENTVLRETLGERLKELKNYQREAFLAGDILGVEESASVIQTLMIIIDKIEKK